MSGQNRQTNSLEVCPHDLIQLPLKDPNFKLSVSGRGLCSQYTGLLGDSSTRHTSAAVFPGHSLLLSVIIIIPTLCPVTGALYPLYSPVTRDWEEVMLRGFSTNIPSSQGCYGSPLEESSEPYHPASKGCLSPCLCLTLMDRNLTPQSVASLWALKVLCSHGYREHE